jgi:hypothetical protein
MRYLGFHTAVAVLVKERRVKRISDAASTGDAGAATRAAYTA